MSIRIIRDPANSLGGHALLLLPDSVVGVPDQTSIRILRIEDEQYLGESGWSPNQQQLGPFPLTKHRDAHAVALGPSIVNALTAFQKLKFDVLEAGISEQIEWPEDIRPLQRTRVRRGVVSKSSGLAASGSAENSPIAVGVTTNNGSEPIVSPQPDEPQESGANSPQTNGAHRQEQILSGKEDASTQVGAPNIGPSSGQKHSENSSKSRFSGRVLAMLAVAVLLIGGVTAYLLMRSNSVEVADSPNQEKPELTQVCDPQSATNADDEARWKAARTCIDLGQTDAALDLMKRLVADKHGPAQLQLGKWYDPEETAESPMRSRNPNTAMRLYANAKEAGIDEVPPLIERLCVSLGKMDGLNEKVTFGKHCAGK